MREEVHVVSINSEPVRPTAALEITQYCYDYIHIERLLRILVLVFFLPAYVAVRTSFASYLDLLHLFIPSLAMSPVAEIGSLQTFWLHPERNPEPVA
jgi:hypothetical protein